MDLRKLRHAVALAEEGNFARAAARLNLTQPALSRSIQALEASLALVLFDRLGSGVRPTAAGARVLEQARAMLRLEAGLRREATLLGRGEAGRVAFGIGPMLAVPLADVLPSVLAAAPGLDVRVEVEAVHRLPELLFDDRIDFYIADTTHAQTLTGVAIRPLAATPVAYYVRAGHPLLNGGADLADRINAFPLASPDLGTGRAAAAVQGASAIACEDIAVLKRATLATDAVLIAMGLALKPELSRGDLVALPLSPAPNGLSHVGTVEHAGRTRSAAAERVIAGFAGWLTRSA